MMVLLVNNVYAVCSQSGVPGTYASGEDVVAIIPCGASDKGDSGFYVWYNSSGSVIENDTFTIPSSSPFVVSASLNINASLAPQDNMTGNLTVNGVYISGVLFNTTLIGAINELNIVSVLKTEEIFEGKEFGITGKIQNTGENVGYSDVCIDILDENNVPIFHFGCTKSELDGEFFLSNICDPSWCIGGVNYIFDLDASCPRNSSSYIGCIQEDGNTLDAPKGKISEAFSVVDMSNKVQVEKWVIEFTVPGVYLLNEHNAKVNITNNPAYVKQQNINWSTYDNRAIRNRSENGRAFLTAGETARLCFIVNNTFDEEKKISIFDITFDTDEEEFYIEGLEIGEEEEFTEDELALSTFVKPFSDDNTTLERCTEEFLIPDTTFGSNDWDVQATMKVEGFEQKIEIESDEFTIFGRRDDEDFIDFLTINSVLFTFDNATEGEPFQLIINITNNHPNHDILADIGIEIDSNIGAIHRSIRPVLFDNGQKTPSNRNIFVFRHLIDANGTDVILSPRFRVPYGLKALDDNDVLSVELAIDIIDEGTPNVLQVQLFEGTQPTLNITEEALHVTNISTTFIGSGIACESVKITTSFDNVQSHTNASGIDENRFILRGCFQDATDKVYIKCADIEIQPTFGSNQNFNFTTALPYVGANATLELDNWIYSYDKKNIDPDCRHCGDLVDTFAGTSTRFNVTSNQDDTCRYSQETILSTDDMIFLQFRQAAALENHSTSLANIAGKTGIFLMNLNCDARAKIGRTVSCDIEAQVEDPNVPDTEVKFDCYILDDGVQRSPLTFNKMITSTPSVITKEFNVLSNFRDNKEYTVECNARYYSGFDTGTTTFADTFVADAGSAILAEGGVSVPSKPAESTIYYDVIVELVSYLQEPDGRIDFVITIINKGDVPDRDGILTYYLYSPEGEVFSTTKEVFEEVPIGETRLMKSLNVPAIAIPGIWQVYVQYATETQDMIIVYDSFEIVAELSLLDKFGYNVTHVAVFWHKEVAK